MNSDSKPYFYCQQKPIIYLFNRLLALHLLIFSYQQFYFIMPPRNAADMLRKGCRVFVIGMLDKEVVIVPIRFDMAGWAFGLDPLIEDMLLKIVPIIPR